MTIGLSFPKDQGLPSEERPRVKDRSTESLEREGASFHPQHPSRTHARTHARLRLSWPAVQASAVGRGHLTLHTGAVLHSPAPKCRQSPWLVLPPSCNQGKRGTSRASRGWVNPSQVGVAGGRRSRRSGRGGALTGPAVPGLSGLGITDHGPDSGTSQSF